MKKYPSDPEVSMPSRFKVRPTKEPQQTWVDQALAWSGGLLMIALVLSVLWIPVCGIGWVLGMDITLRLALGPFIGTACAGVLGYLVVIGVLFVAAVVSGEASKVSK